MKQKCKRCNVFYDTENKDDMGLVCSYHTGFFQDFHINLIGGSKYGKWPCCKELFKDAPGCVKVPHIIDEETAKILSNFNTTNGENTEIKTKKGTPPSSPSPISSIYPILPTITPNPTTPGKPEDEDYITYAVQFGDTLAGIAIRYHTNAGKLKILNKLVTNEEVHTRKTIKIPKSPLTPLVPIASSARQKTSSSVDIVMSKTGASREEASFYLAENNGVVNSAVAEILQDKDWERDEDEDRVVREDEDEDEEQRMKRGCFSWLSPSTEDVKLLVQT